jgi:hypothetical protein
VDTLTFDLNLIGEPHAALSINTFIGGSDGACAGIGSQSTTKCSTPQRIGGGGGEMSESISSGLQFIAKSGDHSPDKKAFILYARRPHAQRYARLSDLCDFSLFNSVLQFFVSAHCVFDRECTVSRFLV